MKRTTWHPASILAGTIFFAAAQQAAARQGDNEIVAFGKTAVVEQGKTVTDVAVFGGSAEIRGNVTDSVAVFGGHATIDGEVGSDVAIIGGSASLGPKALIRGDLAVIGGTLEEAPGARVEGERTTINAGGPLPAAKWLLGDGVSAWWQPLRHWLKDSFVFMRPMPHSHPWAWIMAGLLLLASVLTALLFVTPVERSVAALNQRPATAMLAGALGATLAGPLCVALLLTVVGIIVIPFLLLFGAAAYLLGHVAVARWLGRACLGRAGNAAWETPVVTVLAGTILLVLTYMTPVLGLLTPVIVSTMGLGAVLLATMDALQSESGEASATPVTPAEPVKPMIPVNGEALPRAGFWPRAGAMALDLFIFFSFGALSGALALGPLGWAIYQIAFWSWKSTTIGGIVFGLKGVRLDGQSMDLGVAIVRHLASYLSWGAGLLGFFWAGWDPERQTWHDKIAGTVVVRLPRAQPLI